MLTAFLVVALASLGFSLLSSLFGGDSGDTGGDVHVGADHLDASGADGAHDGVTISELLTLRNFLLFGVGFGATGAIATNFGYDPVPACIFGFVGGIVVAAIGVWFYRLIRSQQGNTAPRLNRLAGNQAHVVTAIPESGHGEVTTNNEFGTMVTLPARSQEGTIREGSTVEIVSVVANIATVKRIF